MGKRIIKVPLTEESISNAIKEVEDLRRELESKANALTERLAMIGVHEASIRFASAMYDGVNDVSVTVEPIERGYRIVAEGEAVCFIEFGAGVYHNPSEPYTEARPDGIVGIGEFGKGKGNQETWAYYGDPGTNGVVRTNRKGNEIVLTHGNPASMPMWYASEEMRQAVETIAREVFAT